MAALFCNRCGREVKNRGQMKPCLKCGSLEFTTRPEFDQALTLNDRRFLRALRIEAPPKPEPRKEET